MCPATISCVCKDSDSDSDVEGGVPECSPERRLARVPDLHGVRFCRVCNDFIPVSRFPRGVRRYTCKRHLWQRTGAKARKTLMQKPRKRLLTRMWTLCYRDSKAIGQRMELKQVDIDRLLDGLSPESALRGDDAAVVPRSLTAAVTKENAVLVSKSTRRRLMGLLRHERPGGESGQDALPQDQRSAAWQTAMATLAQAPGRASAGARCPSEGLVAVDGWRLDGWRLACE